MRHCTIRGPQRFICQVDCVLALSSSYRIRRYALLQQRLSARVTCSVETLHFVFHMGDWTMISVS